MAAVTTESTSLEIQETCIPQPTALDHLINGTEEANADYIKVAVPLQLHALNGNWREAKSILEKNRLLTRTAITKQRETPLHVATKANHVGFVEELVKFMKPVDLELRDFNGKTALYLVAGVGKPQIAEIMINRNPSLPTIKDKYGLSPIDFAVLQGNTEMARFLYENPRTKEIFQEQDWNRLFFNCIGVGIYDLALEIFNKNKNLALLRDDEECTGLHLLARKKFKKSFTKQSDVRQLVSHLWITTLTTVDSDLELNGIIRNPSSLVLDAAAVGNFEFLAELLSVYPDLMWEIDNQNRSIIHFAVLNRHVKLFNLVHEISSIKDYIVTLMDDEDNNVLHLAAKLATPDQLNMVSGAAFQLMLELSWFEEVKKIMPPSHIEAINKKGETPRQLFNIEHRELLVKAERWMTNKANSLMLVSIIIGIGAFSTPFSLLGGSNDETRTPNYLKKPTFLVFDISRTIALISSVTSTIIFLSILISRYATYDFYKSLPLKMIFGLISLFISMASMIVAFGSLFFIKYLDGLNWVPSLISGLAFLVVPSFLVLKFPLWFDIFYSTWSLFRPNRRYALLDMKRHVNNASVFDS